MHTRSAIPLRLTACNDTSELRSLIHEICADHGSPQKLTLMCSAKSPGLMNCMIDFMPNTARVAHSANLLDGRVFGFSTVIFSLTPNPDLKCSLDFPTSLANCSCTPRP